MGVLYYGVNHARKEVFCLGKNGRYSLVEPMKEGKTDEQIIEAETSYLYGVQDKEYLAAILLRIRAFGVDQALHEDWLDPGQGYDDYTYVDSIYVQDADMMGKTVLQYREESVGGTNESF